MGAFPLQLTFQIPGLDSRTVALQRFSDKISDFTPFWNDYFVPNWYAMMSQQFRTEGGFTGSPWAPLTATYAAWKQKHWPGQPIGVLTGAARDSLTVLGDEHAILTISKDSFAVGSDLGYPIYLQLGTRKMAARPPLRVDDIFLMEVGKLLQRFGVEMAKQEKLA